MGDDAPCNSDSGIERDGARVRCTKPTGHEGPCGDGTVTWRKVGAVGNGKATGPGSDSR